MYQLQVERVESGRRGEGWPRAMKAGAVGQRQPVAQPPQQRQHQPRRAVATEEGGQGGQAEAVRPASLQASRQRGGIA